MDVGVFDHLDRGNLPLAEYYETRLKLIEAYDRAGLYAYYVAEHHSTPLGLAPSPSVFLSAIAQRTRRLRFGTMVYVLPLHHPLRMIEEICMLDQMSGGRLELGFGRGSVAMELGYYNVDPARAQQLHADALEVILGGLGAKTLNIENGSHKYLDVPMELEPFQKPHPPIWYGVHSPESAERAARAGFSIVCNEPSTASRSYIERYRAVWQALHGDCATLPRIGVTQTVVVADSDEEALAIARRGYLVWLRSFHFLWKRHDKVAPISGGETNFDLLAAKGKGVAGSPKTVVAFLRKRLAESGANYPIVRFGFGDLSLAESTHSVELFAREVMPALADIGYRASAAGAAA
ncbi:MAG: LLM class flavin-dependent oxidoreductase [Betaproteobacteria bacterium]|nr:LLM class flavin-dependent oxidoreductase [Betaproteobacteria bacterium]